jgi:hypothetical protein
MVAKGVPEAMQLPADGFDIFPAASRRSSGFLISLAQVSGV